MDLPTDNIQNLEGRRCSSAEKIVQVVQIGLLVLRIDLEVTVLP